MFEIKVNKNIVSVQETEPLTSGSVSVYKCRFAFDSSWDGFFRSAVFRVGGMVKTIPLDTTDTCPIPWELLVKQYIGLSVEVSVYGVKDEAEILPTTWDKLGRVRRGSEPGEDAKEFAPSVYDRIVSLVKLYSDKDKGDKGDKGDPGDGDMNASIYDPQGRRTDVYRYAEDMLSAVPEWAMQQEKPEYTASEVGAAPAGYGLGTNSNILLDFNDTSVKTGWYTGSGSSVNYPPKNTVLMYGVVRIERAGDTIMQEVTFGVYSARRRYNNSWGEWEYVNPPMNLGVEYRTPERYIGKPVYQKLINAGTLGNNAEVTLYFGIDNINRIVDCTVTMAGGDRIPTFNSANNTEIKINLVGIYNGGLIRVETNYDASAVSAYVLLKYTKSTD